MDESVIQYFEAKVGVLKLSEAIRIGARIRPQGKVHAFMDGKSCAWGAAWEGLGNPYDETVGYGHILWAGPAAWGEANSVMTAKLGVGVALHNDSDWTREQIADWLESQGL